MRYLIPLKFCHGTQVSSIDESGFETRIKHEDIPISMFYLKTLSIDFASHVATLFRNLNCTLSISESYF